ncbi:hypothetical protein BHM03_00049926 [Ensete ventricosum]|nr:hypothetical protein BHM03_00049926 [Ensete ventricosum]
MTSRLVHWRSILMGRNQRRGIPLGRNQLFWQRRQRGGGTASQGQPPTTRAQPKPTQKGGQRLPHGATTARRGNCPKGRRLRAEAQPTGTVGCGQPVGAVATRGHSRLQHGARKGGRLQGARKGLSPAASPVASRGGGTSRRGGRPLVGRLPMGKGNRRLRKGSDDGGAAEGKEALWHPLEKRMILPL